MKTYGSKFGYEIMGFLTVLFSSILVYMIYKDEPLEAILSAAGIHLLVYGFCLYLNFSTKYTIMDNGILKVNVVSFTINRLT